ncbi:hypothetical protein ACFL2Q_12825 [Thermodesulfobacteriota bacterium]
MKRSRTSYKLIVCSIAAILGVMVVGDCCQAAWKYFQNPYYQFFYRDATSRRIALTMKNKGVYGIEAYRTVKTWLGNSILPQNFLVTHGRIKVYIYPSVTRNWDPSKVYVGVAGKFCYARAGADHAISNDHLKLFGGTTINNGVLLGYGAALTGATSQFVFTHGTLLYQRAWFWNNRSNLRLYHEYLQNSIAMRLVWRYKINVTGRIPFGSSSKDLSQEILASRGLFGGWYQYGGWAKKSWGKCGQDSVGRALLVDPPPYSDYYRHYSMGLFFAHWGQVNATKTRLGWLAKNVKGYRDRADPFNWAFDKVYGKTARHWSTDTSPSSPFLYYQYYNYYVNAL